MTPTAVVEGADGIYRIGRVTEIAPETVDADYTDQDLDERRSISPSTATSWPAT